MSFKYLNILRSNILQTIILHCPFWCAWFHQTELQRYRFTSTWPVFHHKRREKDRMKPFHETFCCFHCDRPFAVELVCTPSRISLIIIIINGLFYGEGMCIFDKDSSWAIIIKDMKVDPTWKVVGLLLPHSLAWDCFHLQIGSFFQSIIINIVIIWLPFFSSAAAFLIYPRTLSIKSSIIIIASCTFCHDLDFGWYWVFEEIRVWTFLWYRKKKPHFFFHFSFLFIFQHT